VKTLTLGKKLGVCFGVVFLVVGLLGVTSLSMIGRLGGLLGRAVNEEARAADLIGAVQLDLHEMKELSTATQFSYAAGNVLKTDSSQVAKLRTLGECSSCHAFGGAEEHRREFAKLADRAAADTSELKALLHSEQARGFGCPDPKCDGGMAPRV
jgi:cytochrome c553